MLILSRRENQALILELPDGEEIVIMVDQINGSSVKIGIKAPYEIKVLREELTIY